MAEEASLPTDQVGVVQVEQDVPPPEPSDLRGTKRPLDDDDDGDSDGPGGERKAGRRKINIEFIEDKSRRHITFSKRKRGIMKKAYELSTLTGTQVLLLVASETGHVYTFATPKLQPLITKPEGKNLIQACLNAPDSPPPTTIPTGAQQHQRMSQDGYQEPGLVYPATEGMVAGMPLANINAGMAQPGGYPRYPPNFGINQQYPNYSAPYGMGWPNPNAGPSQQS
eukprot:Colp12_sorted_trinity150504_noHs@18622